MTRRKQAPAVVQERTYEFTGAAGWYTPVKAPDEATARHRAMKLRWPNPGPGYDPATAKGTGLILVSVT